MRWDALRTVVAVLAITIWVSINEFVRNQVVLAEHWTVHYAGLGLTFPAAPLNGAVWGLWALLLAVAVVWLAQRCTLWAVGLTAWWVGFLLMWVVIGNLGVLPMGILPVAVPWSLLEAFGAAWIARRLK
ncbi:MAG TPA: hypothetical protein PKE21_16270 [Flavobacteriales bacterium]|nr:hypothetical protein [Flavobacteriales bacterium]HMR29035.1 hypothetical protein [Flavobacteriales bacterium]